MGIQCSSLENQRFFTSGDSDEELASMFGQYFIEEKNIKLTIQSDIHQTPIPNVTNHIFSWSLENLFQLHGRHLVWDMYPLHPHPHTQTFGSGGGVNI